MNKIILKGIIRDIEYSHTIKNIDYSKANLIVKRKDGKEDIISLRFKSFACNYKNDDYVELVGNLRSYSRKLDNNKNKVEIYVFTYFDYPTEEDEKEFLDPTNEFFISAKVCKLNELHKTKTGKQNIQFILANNIINNDNTQKINNYIPMVSWGTDAVDISNTLQVNDEVTIRGQLHSRTYIKSLPEGASEIRVAHEGIIIGMVINQL